jgi:hypothetical protein
MEFDMDGTEPKNGRVEGAAICSFAIPLITIVASFVLSLFLPVVVFLFGLWFLLRLKFCIPPIVSIDAGLVAALDVDFKAGIDFELDLDVSAKLDLRADIEAQLDLNFSPDVSAGLKTKYANDLNALAGLTVDLASDFRQSAPPELAEAFPPHDSAPAARKSLPSVAPRLEYYERVERPEALA